MINCFLKIIYVKHSSCHTPLLGTPTTSLRASLAMAGLLSDQETGERMYLTSSYSRVWHLDFLLIFIMDVLFDPEQVTSPLCSLTSKLKRKDYLPSEVFLKLEFY